MKYILVNSDGDVIETTEDFPGAQAVPDDEVAALLMQAALRKIQADFAANLARGYHDEETGITVAMGKDDRAQFEALDAQLNRMGVPDDAVIDIADVSGAIRQITVAAFRGLLTRGGMYYMQLWQQTKQAEAALQPPPR